MDLNFSSVRNLLSSLPTKNGSEEGAARAEHELVRGHLLVVLARQGHVEQLRVVPQLTERGADVRLEIVPLEAKLFRTHGVLRASEWPAAACLWTVDFCDYICCWRHSFWLLVLSFTRPSFSFNLKEENSQHYLIFQNTTNNIIHKNLNQQTRRCGLAWHGRCGRHQTQQQTKQQKYVDK